MRPRNNHYNSNYGGRSRRNRPQGSSGHSNWDWDRKHSPEEDHTRGNSRGMTYKSGDHDGYEQRGRNRSSYYGNDDYDYEYDNGNYGNRNRSNSNYGRSRSYDRRDSNYGSQYAGGFGGTGQQFSPEYGSYSNQRMNRSANYGDDSRYDNYSRGESRRRYDDDDNFFERAGRKIRNAWNDMTDDDDDDNYHGYGTNQRVYGNSRYRSGRDNGRNFFQRAGERIRETWDDLTDRDDRRYREEDDRRYGSRNNQHRSYNLFSRHDDRDFFDRSGPSLRDNRNDWDEYENGRNYRSGRYQRGGDSWFNDNNNRYRTSRRERENMKRGLQESEVW